MISLIDYVDRVGFAKQGKEKGLTYGPAGSPTGLGKRFCWGPAVLEGLELEERPYLLFQKNQK